MPDLIKALRRENRARPPVWLMRQAGRSLPSYQAFRRKYSLHDLFFTPELAAEVTLLPVRDLGVDAAILFSDITAIAKMFGQKLDFLDGKGPVVEPLLTARCSFRPAKEALASVAEAIHRVKRVCDVSLIGFCGGPFTVATYLAEMVSDVAILERMTEASIEHLDLQIDAGVDAIQIFESWGHTLSVDEWRKFCLPYHERLVRHVKRRGVPVISFFRNACHRMEEIAAMEPDAISCDSFLPMAEIRRRVGTEIALQGNLAPELLFAPCDEIERAVKVCLESMRGDPAFIVNLGHGVLPESPPEAVKTFVQTVKRWN